MGLLLQTMANGNSYKNIHVKEIRINPLNFYSRMEEEGFYVDSMATILAEDGQDSSAVVYYDDCKEDGKKYTLIAGERRYKAMLSNLQNGIGDGILYCKVITKPKDELDEQMRIIRDNANRSKSKQVRKEEVSIIEKVWERKKSEGEKLCGRKVEWIGAMIGMSPRQVQNYLMDDAEPERKEKTDEEKEQEEAWKDMAVTIQCRFKSQANLDVRLNKKGLTFQFKDKDEMQRVFQALGYEEFLPVSMWSKFK